MYVALKYIIFNHQRSFIYIYIYIYINEGETDIYPIFH